MVDQRDITYSRDGVVSIDDGMRWCGGDLEAAQIGGWLEAGKRGGGRQLICGVVGNGRNQEQ